MAAKEVLSAREAFQACYRVVRETVPSRWKLLALSFICMIGVAGFTGALAYSTKLIVNDIFVANDPSAAVAVAALVIGVSIGKSFFQYVNSVIAFMFQRSISAGFQKRMFRHTLAQEVDYFGNQSATERMNFVQILGKASGRAVVAVCNKMLVEFLTLVALFTVMLLQDPLMTLMCSVIVPFIFWIVAKLSYNIRAAANAEVGLLAMAFAVGAEVIEGIKTVKSYQLEDKSIDRYETSVDAMESRMLKIAKIKSATIPIMELLGGLVIGLFVVYAAWQTAAYDRTPGEFTAFITAFLLAYQPAERLSNIWVELQKHAVQVHRMYGILDRAPDVLTYGNQTLGDHVPTITLKDVSFAYSGQKKVLKNISLEIPAGQNLAVVGRSGAGKSTLIDLIQRFYDPTEGEVFVDDLDIRLLSKESLHNSVAFVSQEIFLFSGTLGENIADGHPTASPEEIMAAAKAAQLGEVIDGLPNGIDTQIGPNGNALSGGQRQRIALARAILKRAKIYIFDEVTSALDGANERAVMVAIREALTEATLIFVTHRASSLAFVERVLVLQAGEVIHDDTPENLEQNSEEFQILFDQNKRSD